MSARQRAPGASSAARVDDSAPSPVRRPLPRPRPRSFSDDRITSAQSERRTRRHRARGKKTSTHTTGSSGGGHSSVDAVSRRLSPLMVWFDEALSRLPSHLQCEVCHLLDTVAHPSAGMSSNTLKPSGVTVTCSECAVTGEVREAIWICLVCGHRGCGRYFNGHAASHYAISSHRYTIELLQRYMWDYHSDGFIHRVHGREREIAAPLHLTQGGGGGGEETTSRTFPFRVGMATGGLHSDSADDGMTHLSQAVSLSSSAPPSTTTRYLQGLYDSDAEWEDEGRGEGESLVRGEEGRDWALDDIDQRLEGEDHSLLLALYASQHSEEEEGSGADEDDGGLVASKLNSIASHYNHLLTSELTKQAAFYDHLLTERTQLMETAHQHHLVEQQRLDQEVHSVQQQLEEQDREARRCGVAVEERRRRNNGQRSENEFLHQLNRSLIEDQQMERRRRYQPTMEATQVSAAVFFRPSPRVAASLLSKQRQVEALQQRIAQVMAEMDGGGKKRGK